MQFLKQDNSEKLKTKLNRTSYIASPASIEEIQPSIWTIKWKGLGAHMWIIVGSAVAIISLLGIIFIYKSSSSQGENQSAVSIKIDNSNLNSSPTAPETTLAHTATYTTQCVESQSQDCRFHEDALATEFARN